MSDPQISVIIPNYNHARLLPRCLEAQLNQPVLPYEIIVVDDASTDNSMEILNQYAQRNPVIRVFRNEKNSGTNFTVNRGLELSRGDYVLFPAADDEVRPGLYEQAIRMFKAYPQAGVFSGLCEWRDTVSGLSWYIGGEMPKEARYISPQEMVALSRQGRLAISGQAGIYKKSAFIEVGGYIPELSWFADTLAPYAIAFRTGMCHVPEVFSIFYLHPTSYFNSAKSKAERRHVMELMLQHLETQRFADVAPKFRDSGLLGVFGWQMVLVMARQRRHWHFFNAAFARRAIRRSAEVVGRRYLPKWLARWCVKIFYRRS